MPKTTLLDIVWHWSHVKDECHVSVDWTDAHERCWRCAYKAALDRCHIIPESLGGEDIPENLVLLCKRCHREAPNVNDPEAMWIWIQSQRAVFYDSFWTIRGIEEFERMFGRQPFSETTLVKVTPSEIIQRAIKTATIHFGEGRLNPSTIAFVLRTAEELATELELGDSDADHDVQRDSGPITEGGTLHGDEP